MSWIKLKAVCHHASSDEEVFEYFPYTEACFPGDNQAWADEWAYANYSVENARSNLRPVTISFELMDNLPEDVKKQRVQSCLGIINNQISLLKNILNDDELAQALTRYYEKS